MVQAGPLSGARCGRAAVCGVRPGGVALLLEQFVAAPRRDMNPAPVSLFRHVTPDSSLWHVNVPRSTDEPYGSSSDTCPLATASS